jgi:hypothetical protein
MRALVLALAGALAVGCGGGRVPRPYATPSAAEVLAALAARRDAARSFNHTGTMDFWSGDDRVKNVTVYVMGERGQKIRMNVLDPGGGMTMADLACDGTDFAFVDHRKECSLTGPCSEASIAQLMRVRLAPDDFVLLALGQPALIAGDARAAVRWDGQAGRWRLDLVAPDGRKQTLELSGDAGKAWDVLAARAYRADGTLDWVLSQKGFGELAAEDGARMRVPGAVRFEQKAEKADLIIRWDERALNPTLGSEKFTLVPPAGLTVCGAKAAPPPAPAR